MNHFDFKILAKPFIPDLLPKPTLHVHTDEEAEVLISLIHKYEDAFRIAFVLCTATEHRLSDYKRHIEDEIKAEKEAREKEAAREAELSLHKMWEEAKVRIISKAEAIAKAKAKAEAEAEAIAEAIAKAKAKAEAEAEADPHVCPFCGSGDLRRVFLWDGRFTIQCQDCAARGPVVEEHPYTAWAREAPRVS